MYYASSTLIQRCIFATYRTHKILVLQCSVSWLKIHSNTSCSDLWKYIHLLPDLSLWQKVPFFYLQFPPLLKTPWKGLYVCVTAVPAGTLVLIQVSFIFHWSGTSHLLFSCPTLDNKSWQNRTRGTAGRSNVLTAAERFDKDRLINPFCWDRSQWENSKRV